MFVKAQTPQSYYILEKEGFSIEPTQKVINQDETLTLTFLDTALQNYFQGKTVYKYDLGFPTASSGYLSRVYEVTILGENLETELSSLSNIEFVEKVPEEFPAYEPNDTYYHYTNSSNKKQLELIRSLQAWDVTNGSPFILVGVADDNIEITHEDITNQIIYHYEYNSSGEHGTPVVGMIGAETDNGKGIAAVGFNIKLVTKEMTGANSLYELAQYPGVKVINYSRFHCSYSQTYQQTVQQIREEFGVLLVACAGNAHCGGADNYAYPASYDYVMSVSSVGHLNYIGEGSNNFKDVHERYLGNPSSTHQHNDKVDIVAPGYNVTTTKVGNTYGSFTGTSFASPTVAGAAGLVLSVKSDLDADELESLLKNTADDIYWIPYNYPYIGKLGSGRLNVFRAVKTAQCMDEANPVVDLLVRDTKEDVGNEPNNESTFFWKSEDIWARHQNDGRYNDTHQNIEYDGINPTYVYIRVTNYGCQTSSGEDELRLYWSFTGTSLSWPSAWNGILSTGGPVGTVVIPELNPGQEAVLEFEWYPPNPDLFGPTFSNENFSLLTRIISNDDPITSSNGANIYNYVKQNNNVAMKNIISIDVSSFAGMNPSAAMLISNFTEENQIYSISFSEAEDNESKALYQEAEIGIKMDSILYNGWLAGGANANNIDSTHIQKHKRISATLSSLNNIELASGEIGVAEISFNFLTKELTEKEYYEYDIIQRDANTNEIVGGVTLLINKENREAFMADADIISNENSTKLVAEDIGESAVYNWYNSQGDLIYTGTELIVDPEITELYNLEIISNLDGFKDYKKLAITGTTPFSLISLVPNPAENQVNINYDVTSATSAYLVITNILTGNTNNYILEVSQSETIVNTSSYSQGLYTVTLIANGVVIESKNLLKN